MIKLVVMIKRKPGMSKEAFDRYWSGPHADQVLGCGDFKRHVRRYVQSHVVAQQGIRLPWAVSEYDGQAELSFDSIEEMNAAFNEPRFLAEIHPDDATFIDMEACKLMVVEEIWKLA
jgi:uncharacterized protein (TIGR02118 family)